MWFEFWWVEETDSWALVVKGKVGTHQWNVRLVDLWSNRFFLVSQMLVRFLFHHWYKLVAGLSHRRHSVPIATLHQSHVFFAVSPTLQTHQSAEVFYLRGFDLHHYLLRCSNSITVLLWHTTSRRDVYVPPVRVTCKQVIGLSGTACGSWRRHWLLHTDSAYCGRFAASNGKEAKSQTVFSIWDWKHVGSPLFFLRFRV